uniref:Uncharacterized protein n=1 Tax=Anguilla anguilla TaxID=7936 RepID=A0A0E9RR41_ANGAN
MTPEPETVTPSEHIHHRPISHFRVCKPDVGVSHFRPSPENSGGAHLQGSVQ